MRAIEKFINKRVEDIMTPIVLKIEETLKLNQDRMEAKSLEYIEIIKSTVKDEVCRQILEKVDPRMSEMP